MSGREIRAGSKILPHRVRIGEPGSFHMTFSDVRSVIKKDGHGEFYVIMDGSDAVVCFDDVRIAMLIKMKFGK